MSMMNRRRLVLASGAAALAGCTPSAPRRSGLALARDLDQVAQKALALDVVPGLSVAVYTREGVYARGFGLADIGTGEAATADTVFYIASSTKSMTSLALAMAILEARGDFDLNATPHDYAPDAPFPAAVRAGEVRFRNFLSHTGGIANEPIEFRFTDTGQHDDATLWRLLSASEPNSEAPLGRFDYANVGYNITTILTDRRLGVRWQDLLQREIFDPAGMTRTSARMSRALASQRSIAKPHVTGPSGMRARIYLEKTDQTMHSAGGVVMSANDALRWLELMIEDGSIGGRRIVPAEVVQATRTPLAAVNVEFEGYRRDSYGLGWYVGPYRDQRMLHHFGGFTGFRAHISYLPDAGIGVAVFVNDSSGALLPVNAIANYVYDRAGGYADAEQRLDADLAAAAARRVEGAREILDDRASRAGQRWTLTRPRAAYIGAYENPIWGRIEVASEGEALVLTCGVLRAVAEPSTEPDSVWAELDVGEGAIIRFEGAGPDALSFEGVRFVRA